MTFHVYDPRSKTFVTSLVHGFAHVGVLRIAILLDFTDLWLFLSYGWLRSNSLCSYQMLKL